MNKKKENALNLNVPYEEVLAFKDFDAYETLLLRYLIRKGAKGLKQMAVMGDIGGKPSYDCLTLLASDKSSRDSKSRHENRVVERVLDSAVINYVVSTLQMLLKGSRLIRLTKLCAGF